MYLRVTRRFARQPDPAKVETFDRKRIITDGERSVELIGTGESLHQAENVVVYLPQDKILFKEELFYHSAMAAFPARDPSRNRIMRFFGEWLIKNNIMV
jgi:flavorubredoxin